MSSARHRLAWLPRFKRDYRKLPAPLKAQVDQALLQMEEDLRYPSLRVKKMQGGQDIWEARVTRSCRITFNLDGDLITLRTVGDHDVLKHP